MQKRLSLLLCSPLLALATSPVSADEPIDVVLIGGGIMSATLGTYLQELVPEWDIHLYERLGEVAQESSNAWNNAGSGHSAFMEMNYTPDASGRVEIQRAINVTEQFEISRQFWAHQVENGILGEPSSFINSVPHIAVVWGDEDVSFLRERYDAMTQNPLYAGMEYSEDRAELAEWMPLIMEGRDNDDRPVAATRMQMGTEVNYGAQAREMVEALTRSEHFTLGLHSEVRDLSRNDDDTWQVTIAHLDSGEESTVDARYVFIGAGGAALPLLQASGIPEAEVYAGFPVGGQFLYTTNPDVVSQHDVKAYGKAGEGSPPMSVPHLDLRYLDGEPALFFGPFATFSSKFLKEGSWTDLFGSMTLDNTWPMMEVGLDNFNLVSYLVGQVLMSDDRFEALQAYYPNAQRDDWTLWTAGQRVQIIKNDPERGGVLQFGTEVVTSQDGTMSALLGASPGASTAPSIMLGLLDRVFPTQVASDEWQSTLTEIIPSYGQKLAENPELLREVRAYTAQTLNLDEPMNLPSADEASQDEPSADEESMTEESMTEESSTEAESTTEA